ncbi:MAG TPA: CARDB domain-containing protein [Thermoleophilaceae bacterium]|nr:CARDB domain-containing protein [Thermoleophilaceae bacterium]
MNRLLAVTGFLAVLLVFATTGPATAAPSAGAAAAARPDLGLTKKSVVRLKSGRVSGAFVVRNSGRAGARRFRAALSVKVAKKYRVIKRYKLRALKRKRSRRVKVSVKLPAGLPAGNLPLRLCVDTTGRLKERSEKNNCRRVGTAKVKGGSTPVPPAGPVDSRPRNPVPFTKDTVFKLDNYWITVPQAYDASHNTPITLFVWSHGCGGMSSGDIATVSPGGTAQTWIAVAADGREGLCWDVNADPALIMNVVATVKTHFNINPRRVVLGGYSSGGDLSYRTAFTNARTFAGVLAENTAPFRDTGLSQQAAISGAAWKFNVVHLAHTEDDTYPIDTVRNEVNALKGAGFPATLIERPGTHFDNDTPNSGTDHDLKTLLLPRLNDGWLSP